MSNVLIANWQVPPNVIALTTTRQGGFSLPPYQSNNLATHVGEESTAVMKNRNHLIQTLNMPNEPVWLEQTHSSRCILVEEESSRDADAALTRRAGTVLAILTADCVPILLCNRDGSEIAAIHGGWRGLVDGVIENTLNRMNSDRQDLTAWIGPAICQTCYEVGESVRTPCLTKHPFAEKHFIPRGDKWLADLPGLAEEILLSQSISTVFQSRVCTYEQNNEFFSYRRQPQTGRMATLIWVN